MQNNLVKIASKYLYNCSANIKDVLNFSCPEAQDLHGVQFQAAIEKTFPITEITSVYTYLVLFRLEFSVTKCLWLTARLVNHISICWSSSKIGNFYGMARKIFRETFFHQILFIETLIHHYDSYCVICSRYLKVNYKPKL